MSVGTKVEGHLGTTFESYVRKLGGTCLLDRRAGVALSHWSCSRPVDCGLAECVSAEHISAELTSAEQTITKQTSAECLH